MTIGVHTGDNQVLSCALDITEVTGHTLARENTARILTVTDRTGGVCRHGVTVAGAVGREVMTLDCAGKTLTDCRTRNVNFLTFGEHIDGKSLTDFHLADLVFFNMEFFEHGTCFDTSFFKLAFKRLAHTRRLLGAEGDLHCIVAVSLNRFYLCNAVVRHFEHGYGNGNTIFGKDARHADLATDEADFFKRLDKMMDIAARSLKVKRNVITKLLNEGLYPYTKYYLGNFDNHFSTIGLVGMNEAGLNANWIRADMTTEKCQEFTKKVLNHMRERLSDYQEQYGDLYNLEATPAESTSYRLAKHDVEQYPDIITASQGDTPYYTNSSHLPVSYTDDIFSALDIQDELQTLYTSGTVFHAFLGEKLPDWEAAANLVRKIAENYKLPYYTISPTYSVCKNHGYLTGEQFTCPECGESAEVYSRITGYYRPVQNWNAGKTQEYKERKEYNIGTSVLKHKGPLHPEAKPEQEPAVEEELCENSTGKRKILFTRENCPNCRIVYSYLDKAGFDCEKIMAEENVDLALSYGVKQAPTLVIVDGEHVEKFAGAGAIKNYLFK